LFPNISSILPTLAIFEERAGFLQKRTIRLFLFGLTFCKSQGDRKMKSMKLVMLALALLGAVLAITPTAALAAYADVWADINLGSVSIEYTGEGNAPFQYETNAEAGGQSDTNGGAAPVIEAYAEMDGNFHWAWGLVDDTDLYTNTYVEGVDGFSNLAYADAGLYGQYKSTTAGTLSISFDYFLAYNVSTENKEWAFADAEAMLTIGGKSVSDQLLIEAFNGMAFDEETPWYTLTMSYDLAAGQCVDFSAVVASQAAVSSVPVPSAVWLLGTALISLVGLRRKMS
jgi:hypothetical protein